MPAGQPPFPAVEHTSIQLALQVLDMAPAGGAARPLLLAWSSREALLLEPQYAWLSHPCAVFVRLPVTLEELRSLLAAAEQTGTHHVELQQLLRPCGQLTWAVGEIASAAAMPERFDELPARLVYLRRFVAQHWPGWWEPVLEHLDASIALHQLDQLDAVAELVALHAGEVAAASEICGTAWYADGTDGSPGTMLDQLAQNAAAWQDAMTIVQEGAAPWSAAAAVLGPATWCEPAGELIAEVIGKANDVGAIDDAAGEAAVQRLIDCRNALVRATASLAALSTAASSVDHDDLAAGIADLGEVLAAVDEQAALAARLRAALAGDMAIVAGRAA